MIHILWQAHSTRSQVEGKFNVVPYESGRYKFCLALSSQRKASRNARSAVAETVMWDLHVGHVDHGAGHAKEEDTKGLWHAGGGRSDFLLRR